MADTMHKMDESTSSSHGSTIVGNGKHKVNDIVDEETGGIIVQNSNTKEVTPARTKSFIATKRVPHVQITLENVTYQPITANHSKASFGSKESNNNNHRTKVLNNVSTTISPFKLTAWMGPSGSGKTSLTSVVAGLIEPNSLSDESIIRVNGDEGTIPKQYVGVVWQDDLLLSNLTVQEVIYFAARLKTPRNVPNNTVMATVHDTMSELGLLHVKDTIIGSAASGIVGISGGERKRTAVAAELVVRPSLLLLDEPTSGLDATTAYSLIQTLQHLAVSGGHAIAIVIHQPRTDIFRLFDHLLVLSKGNVVYDGQPNQIRSYLESCPQVSPLPPETGIADWIMDTIIHNERQQQKQLLLQQNKEGHNHEQQHQTNMDGFVTLGQHWQQHGKEWQQQYDDDDDGSTNIQNNGTTMKRFTMHRILSTLKELQDTPLQYEASFWRQFQLLSQRTHKQRRGERLTIVSILLTLCYTLFTCLCWWQLPNTTAHTFARNSLIFFMLIAQGNSIVVSSVKVFQVERVLLRRERAKKLYGVLPYFLAKTISDMTNNVLLPCVYGIIIYFAAGFQQNFFKFVLAYYLTLSSAQSMGFMLSILIPNETLALTLAPPITLFLFILGGFYIPVATMHVGIKWASYISFARYGYAALLINEYEGEVIPCDINNAVSIGSEGTTCPVPGELVYESLGITQGPFFTGSYWTNVTVVALLQLLFLTVAYFALRRSK